MDSTNSNKKQDDFTISVADKLGIKRVSIEDIKMCKGFENISDEEAQMVVESLYQLSLMTYQLSRQ